MKILKNISGIIVLLIMLLSVNHVFAEDSKKDAGKMIDEMAALYMDNMKIPGLAIGISMPDGKVIEKYYGKANIEYNAPVEKDTIFPIGSLSKTHTAIAIMLLKEQGKLNVNDKITKYFPDCVAWDKITIKNLMQHTSGIQSITAVEPFRSNQMKDWKPEEIVAILKPLKLDFEPGTNAQYSNSGCILLSMIIEKVSGMTYNKFLQKNIANPLGMTNTMFVSNRIVVPKRASGYATVDGETQNAEYASTLAPFGSGGIISNITDILKLKEAFSPGKLLKKESIEEMFAITKLNNGRDYVTQGPIGTTYGYCLETLITPDGKIVPGKAGAISGFKSQFFYFKDNNIFIAITANLDMMSPAVGEKLKGLKMIDCPLLMSLQLFEIVKSITTQGPPPIAKQPGAAPKAAMLPILSSNEPAVSSHATIYLEKCLQERNAFNFVSREKVDQAIAAGGYDMTKIFGLSTGEYKALADTLGVNYVLHGIVAVRKSLKFTGWRKDVDVYIKLYDGKTGESIDNWRSMTDFAFTDAGTELDAKKMGESAANHICKKIIQSGF